MKRNTALFMALCFASLVNSQNGANIEYKVTSSKGATGTIKINFSEFGSLSEFNMVVPQMPGGGITSKGLAQKSVPDSIYMINDKTKTYSVNKKGESSKDDSKTYTVTKIGDEKINGYNCAHATVSDGTESHEVWNTKDISEFGKYAEAFRTTKRMGSQKQQDALKAANCDGLPVRIVHKGNEREGDMTMELVKMEKKSYNKSDFEIPSDYTRSAAGSAFMGPGGMQMKTQQELMSMTPEERAKYIDELKKKYGK